MDRRVALVLAVTAFVATLAVPVRADSPPARYIVVYRNSVDVAAKTDELERAHRFASEFRYAHALRGFAARLSSAQLAKLRADPNVEFISPDRALGVVDQVPLLPGDSAPTGVRRIAAATTTTASRASDVGVAVIDTGIDLGHPDLNAIDGTNCIRKNSRAQDDNGHGTHVAGTIAAKNNGSGVVGVAPGTRVYAVKVLDAKGSGTDAQVICGIDWVTAKASALGIKVANMSLGGPGADDRNCGSTNFDALHAAVCRSIAAGIVYVVAAGNSAVDFVGSVPANYDEALTVTAMSDFDGLPGGTGSPGCLDGFFESDDASASFSNFTGGEDSGHTIAAPGVCITSTWPGGGYRTISGTSMASPHVAGAVALCFGAGGVPGRCAGLTPAQVRDRMRGDAAAHALSTPGDGFAGDPQHAASGFYFGNLVWAGAPDITPPVISGVSASSVTDSSATVVWTTDERSDGQVAYGLTVAYGSSSAIAPALVTSHSIALSGLNASTTYHFGVKSRDAWGNLAASSDFTFTTAAFLPDLVLTGSAAPEPVVVGSPLTYDLTLLNKGPASATAAAVAISLPAGVSVVSTSATQGSCTTSGQSVTCALGALGVGAAAQVLADRPVGFWRLGEPAGSTTAADASGSGNAGSYEAGILLGQPGAVPGDTAAAFSGQSLVIPAQASLNLTTGLTVEAWVRPSAANLYGGIFEKTIDGAVNSQFSLFFEAGVVKFRGKPATTSYLTLSGPALPVNAWSHVAGTYDGTTLRLYVNASLVASSDAPTLAGGSGLALIGHLGSGFYPFQGTLDEVALFPQALSPDRLRAHFLGGVALRLVVTASAAGTATTTATASAAQPDPDPSTNALTLRSTVQGPLADLVLTGSAAPEPVVVGSPLTYDLTLLNKGPASATAAAVAISLPAGVSVVSTSATQGSCTTSGQSVTCALGALGVGAAAQVLADRPVGFWRLGEPAGSTTAADASGSGNAGSYEAGILLGQPGAVPGDTAAAFSGQSLVIPAQASLNLTTGLTVEAWVRPSAANLYGGIFEKTIDGAVNSQFSLFFEAGVVKFRGKPATTSYLTLSGPALPVNAWSHVAGTYDGTTLRLYVNASLVASSDAPTLAGGSGLALIGHLGSGFYPFQGTLDEVALFPQALSPDRLRAHFLGGVALRLVVTASAAGTATTTATASAAQPDPDPSTNALTLRSTVQGP